MIDFTPEQQEAVDYILEQINLGDMGKNVIISGQGGVGKTEMICELVGMLLVDGKRVAVAAMTGKATSILRSKIYKKINENGLKDKYPRENLLVNTIQKITKESKAVGVTPSGETIFSNTWRDPTTFNYDVLIIDELSMVPHFVSLWWQKTKCRVIGLGDFCQLPEVTTQETQKELAGFRHDLHLPPSKMVSGYGVKVLKDMPSKQLTKVLRSDNEIALLCNDLRDFSMTKQETVGVIKNWAKNSENIQYATSLDQLETGMDWQIICYTNKMCQQINDALCIGGEFPSLKDKILLCDNINPIHCYNGETYTLEQLIDKANRYDNECKQKARPGIFVCFKFNNKMPRKDSKYAVERASFEAYRSYKEVAGRHATNCLNSLESILKSSAFATAQVNEWLGEIDEIRQQETDASQAFNQIIQHFEEVDLDCAKYIMQRVTPAPRLYICHIEYGYAITTHKSQGSEYENVCYILERFDKPLLYTGVSRAKKRLKVINLTSTK